ncbi:MAG TPA: hypothetical protein VHZ98_01085 [Galbitalea sp.]|jgi:hypothetical protein|nr:hypothetical protein [Galbitalea sp.]
MPWYAWIAILFVVMSGIGGIVGSVVWGRRRDESPELAKAISDNAEVNKALLEKLGTIESRLGAVEKTLNDIPN